MANLTEAATFDAGVYRIETTDQVIGGETGISNKAAKNLANRTNYLKNRIYAGTETGCGAGVLKRVTHLLNIPVINQVISVSVTYKNSGAKAWADLAACEPSTCNHTANYFDIFVPLASSERDVDWIIFDTR